MLERRSLESIRYVLSNDVGIIVIEKATGYRKNNENAEENQTDDSAFVLF
jgi:hypothetical protein